MPNASASIIEPSGPVLAPIFRRTVGDDVVETLRKAIIAGGFGPGDHMGEASLAQQLGVSRAPVREAMLQLEREGLLVFDRRGAALVKVFSAGDFEEIFTLRLALEVMAARLACRKMSPADAAALEANIQRTSAAAKLLEVTRLDVQFHDMIMASARHSRLGSAWANLRPQIEFWLARMHGRLEASNHKTRDETAQSHRGLLEALRSKSPSKAEKAMQDHIEGWRIQFPFEEIVAGRKLS